MKILHLSDVHFGQPDHDEEQDRIVDAVVEAVREHGLSADLIIFNGDLAYDGKPTQFAKGEHWLKRILEITGGRIAICPGNHDIQRGLADKDTLRLAHNSSENLRISKSKIASSHAHLSPFFQWHRQFVDAEDKVLPLWLDDSNLFASSIAVEGMPFKSRVIAINTSVLSCDNDDKGKLIADVAALNRELHLSKASEELVIVIGHHALRPWLVEWNAAKIESLLGQETGPHLYFHGHNHEVAAKGFTNSSGQGVAILECGACYQGSAWAQYFNHYEIDLGLSEIRPQVFKFSNDSGKWFVDNAISRPIKARLPSNAKLSPIVVLGHPVQGEDDSQVKFDNPFDDIVTNSTEPHLIPKLFVDENNFINRVSNPIDTMIEGQRGTGKTMLLRYLSIDVQSSIIKSEGRDVLSRLIERAIPFGVYTRLSNAGFNRTDNELIGDDSRRESLFGHRLALNLISNTINSLNYISDSKGFTSDVFARIANFLSRTLREPILKDCKTWYDIQLEVKQICDHQIQLVDEHMASLLPGGDPIKFNPIFSIDVSFVGLLGYLKEFLGLKAPFYLLLDDFDVLSAQQQTAVFRVAADRNLTVCCFKYGIMTLGQKTIMAGVDKTYRTGDDYEHIMLTWLDRGLSKNRGPGNYRKTVLEIAKKRLEASNWPKDLKFETLLDTWRHGSKIRAEVKDLAEITYNTRKGKKPSTFKSLWEKQGDMLFFRHLRKHKIENRYAGVDNVVDLSSGIFRQFLEMNSKIVSAALDSNWRPTLKKKIGHEIQNSAIREYSSAMLRILGQTGGDTSAISGIKGDVTSLHLVNLANSLIWLFSSRLYGDTDDGEVTAISVKGAFNEVDLAKTILDVAVRESILQRRMIDYSAKSFDDGKLPTFYLNKRLAPKGNLGMKMQGRVEISKEDVILAATDPEKFKDRFRAKGKSDDQNQPKLEGL